LIKSYQTCGIGSLQQYWDTFDAIHATQPGNTIHCPGKELECESSFRQSSAVGAWPGFMSEAVMNVPARLLFAAIVVTSVVSCKSWRPGFFVQRTPREEYAASIRDNAAAVSWQANADSALAHPFAIALPYRETGRMDTGVNAAAVLQFEAREGEQIVASPRGFSQTSAPFFIELYRYDGVMPVRLRSPEAGAAIQYNVEAAGRYGLLIQSKPDSVAQYSLTIVLRPSLAYPVTNPARNRIGSVWGDARDGGARRHEGVDIFAPKGSPALAAAPGRIVRLTNSGIGGKTVWLRPDNRSISLYYAHLDSQWVREGDFVQTGDTLGQVGNTGNARFTAAHLHFGIYGAGGAIDPASFVRPADTATRAPAAPIGALGSVLTSRELLRLQDAPSRDARTTRNVPPGTQIRVVAATGAYLRIIANNSISGWVPYSQKVLVR
jgi:murein DD-endopeptidase MepM/ murein hydrolase activator NlpD